MNARVNIWPEASQEEKNRAKTGKYRTYGHFRQK